MTEPDYSAPANVPEPPYDLGAEQAVLGAMMLSRDALLDIAPMLSVDSFYRPVHGTIYQTILEVDGSGVAADPITVATALADAAKLDRVGGAPYLHTLIASVPTAANGTHYAKTVAARATARYLLKVAGRITQLASTPGQDPSEAVSTAMDLLAEIEASSVPDNGGPDKWEDIVPWVLDDIEGAARNGVDQTPGVPTGLIDLDQLLNGFHPGQLIVVGARPGVGKSVALAGFARAAAWKHKLGTLIFSMEMTKLELGRRFISADSQVPLHKLNTGNLDDDDWTKVTNSIAASMQAPMWIDDTADLSLADIRARVRKHIRTHGELAMIGIDYLQLMRPARSENRQVAVSAMSRGCKLMAKEFNVPVVLLSQLNRGPEMRGDKRPGLSDLRESGSIEQDADVVILLHREDYHDPESARAGEADFIVAKHRNGATDTVTTAAQLHVSRFESMSYMGP